MGFFCLLGAEGKRRDGISKYNGDPEDNAETAIVFGRIPTSDYIYSHVAIAGRH